MVDNQLGVDSDDEGFRDIQPHAKPGPIDNATKDTALGIKQEYEDHMLALAKEKGISVHSLFQWWETSLSSIGQSPLGMPFKNMKRHIMEDQMGVRFNHEYYEQAS